jgi:hypothetical protein
MRHLLVIVALIVGVYFATQSQDQLEENIVLVDPALKPYVREWCYEMEKAGIIWEPGFRNLKSIQLATYSVEDEDRVGGLTDYDKHTITVNRKYAQRGECIARNVVFHELGHAVFGLEHGCCSIMETDGTTYNQQYCDGWGLMVEEYVVQCKKAADE